MEIFKWENLTKNDLERHYNPRVAVPNAQDYIDDFIERSDDARKNISGSYDIRYGDKPKQTLDLHLPQNTFCYLNNVDKLFFSQPFYPFFNLGILISLFLTNLGSFSSTCCATPSNDLSTI